MFCKGIITDLVGQPIPKAIITIKSIRGATAITSSVYFHQCNDKGEYNFSLLKGKYKIWVQNSNFSDKNLVGVGVVESDTPDGDIDSILVAEVDPTPDEPITPSSCECSWIKKTFIPTYFYISRDSSVADVSEEEIQNFFNNLVVSYNYNYERERFSPLVKLNVDGDVYALPIPHVTGSNNLTLYAYSFIGIVDDSSYPERTTPPFYNETPLNIYASTGVMYGNKISLTLYKDSYKGYLFLSHNNTETDPTPMTFKFLETIKPFVAEEDEPEVPPEDNPDIPPEEDDYEPEGVLTPYTVKVRFSPDYWYDGDAKFGAYCIENQTWKEATKVVDDVVYYTFTEEETNSDCTCIFTRHNPSSDEISWSTLLNQTNDIVVSFDTEILNDVVTIDANTTTQITVGSAYI